MDTKKASVLRRFRRISVVTTLATVFLIWVGGWVRSTGSGMGCPDWPKCFGVWVPPTSEAQLPANYLEHYVELRKAKNERVAKLLSRLGFDETATKIQNDPSVSEHEPFNAYKTWTEYINRLIGVVVGLLIFLTVLFAWPTRAVDKRIFWLSLAAFVGVGFEGWLGSIVVSTNLMPSFITVHMVVAMLILMLLIAAALITYVHERETSRYLAIKPMGLVWGGVGVSALVLVQIIAGTQVRESVDMVSKALGEDNRQIWLENLSGAYTFHKFFYYVVAVAIGYWIWQLKGRFFQFASIRNFSVLLLGTLILEIALGIGMHRFGIPPVLQPLHLLLGTVIFAAACTVTGLLYLGKGRVKGL